ncbi:MAG: phosphoribosylanthranilate isomerase [Kiritimatiellae bacterium]|nr:phosphoribosylanthranilate isomerase [Kiritimatiellia bacterium]
MPYTSGMSLFVKICGIARAVDAEAAAALGPDALGFVFHPSSPRAVRPAQVRAWSAAIPPTILKVGVFVDVPPDRVSEIAREAGLDVAQLHGRETPEAARASWPRTWKALPVDDELENAAGLPWPCEALLLDTPGGPMPGGTGRAADWTHAAAFVQNAPLRVILAGGLGPDTVASAVRAVRPWGVDASSALESQPGRKDAARMKDFVQLCRTL